MKTSIKAPSRMVAGKLEPIKENSIAYLRPDLLLTWDFAKNTEDPFEISSTEMVPVFWKCPECDSEWQQSIRNRVESRKSVCPDCGGYCVKAPRSLQSVPELMMEYDRHRNTTSPENVYIYSREPRYWKCHKCGYEWAVSIKSRLKGKRSDGSYDISPCPCCKWINQSKPIGYKYPQLQEIVSDQNETNLYELDTLNRRMLWDCPFCGRTFKCDIYTVLDKLESDTLFEMCPHNGQIVGPHGTIFDEYPELELEWSEDNAFLQDPKSICGTCTNSAIWKCPDCGHKYFMRISDRVMHIERETGPACPYCNGRIPKRIHHF